MSNVGPESKYAAPGSEKVALLLEEKSNNLKIAFDSFVTKGKKNLMKCEHIPACLQRAGIGAAEGLPKEELDRIMVIAPIVTSKEGLTLSQLKTLARDAFNVNMLHKLFEASNTDTTWEKVECFLDTDEIVALYQKLGIPVDKAHIESFIDNLDRDGDGRVDWEEFLTFSQELLGGRIIVATDDPDGTDFNQLRDDLKYFDDSLKVTDTVVAEYHKKIDDKKKEIQQKIKDTTMEDVRKKLKAEWDAKDELELLLLSNTIKYFQGMEKVCRENDKEKEDLVVVWNETKAKRDMVRMSMQRSRQNFKKKYNERFGGFVNVLGLLEQIQKDTVPLFDNLERAEETSVEADAVWKEVREFEKQPVPSKSDATLDFLNAQSKVLEQIRTKMQIMQRERDKYEEMIEEELDSNKNARIEIINMNLAMQMMDTRLVQMAKEYKTKVMENKSLQFEVVKTGGGEGGGGSKKVQKLKGTSNHLAKKSRQNQAKITKLQDEIANIEKKTEKFSRKGKKLQVELGELKVLIDSLQAMEEEDSAQMQALLDDSDFV